MGKIRIKTLGVEDEEKKQKADAKKRAEEKRIEEAKKFSAAKKAETAKSETTDTASTESIDTSSGVAAEQPEEKKPTKKYTDKKAKKQKRSSSYLNVSPSVDKKRVYRLKDALELLPKLKRAKFDETVELHINTAETGVSGSVVLPHGTGKQMRVAIANDDIIAQVEKGIIEFDILIAEPQMMPKLARVAKFLGPRGLMPNPKNGTITQKPEETAKKYEAGQMNFKTESKFPILHLTVGKVSFGDQKLTENIKTMIKAVQLKNIKSATLKSTMSPGIRIDTTSV